MFSSLFSINSFKVFFLFFHRHQYPANEPSHLNYSSAKKQIDKISIKNKSVSIVGNKNINSASRNQDFVRHIKERNFSNISNDLFPAPSKTFPANIYLFKVDNRNSRKRCEICSKVTIKAPELHHWRRFDVFVVNFEHSSHLFLEFLLLNLNK